MLKRDWSKNGSYSRTSLFEPILNNKAYLIVYLSYLLAIWHTESNFPKPFIRHYKTLQTCGRLVFISLWCNASEWSLDQEVLLKLSAAADRGKTGGKEEQSQKLFQKFYSYSSLELLITPHSTHTHTHTHTHTPLHK